MHSKQGLQKSKTWKHRSKKTNSKPMKQFFLVFLFLRIMSLSHGQIKAEDHNVAVDQIQQADALITNSDYIDAIPLLESAIKLDSTIKSAYLMIHKAFFNTGDNVGSLTYLKKAKTIFVDDDQIVYYLAKSYHKEKAYDFALYEYNQAIELGKKNGEDFPLVYDYYASRGICYLMKKKYEEALSDFEYSIKLNDSKGSVYANKGIALFQLQRFDEACASWVKAYNLGETSVKRYLDKNCKNVILQPPTDSSGKEDLPLQTEATE